MNSYGDKTLIERVQEMTEQKWNAVSRGIGAAAGALCGAMLFFAPDTATFGSYKFIVALAVMLLGPRIAENQLQRDTKEARIAMLLSFGALLAISMAYNLMRGNI